MEFCVGGTVILTASEGGKYTWNTGANTRDIEANTTGSYTVAVESGSIECTSLPVAIMVHPSPTASFTVSAEDEGDGYLASFSNQSTGASAWQWDFGDGQFSDQKNPSHLYAIKDEYTITLTSTSAEGCEATESTPLGPVTGAEAALERVVDIYPNPVTMRTRH